MSIIALSDIHGRYDCLVAMHDKLTGIMYGTDHTLVLCGDYMDRGPQSKEVMEAVISGTKFFTFAKEVICLKGNHEDIFVDAICDNRWDMFLNNGGVETMVSLLGCQRNEVERRIWPGNKGHMGATNFSNDPKIKWILDFVKDLPLYHKIGKYFFVHAGVNPHIPIDEQTDRIDEFDNLFLWIRNMFLEENKDQGYTIVHGHTPHSHDHWLDEADYRVNLDSGANFTGLLSAIVIEDPEDRDAYNIITVKLPGKRD